MIRKIFSLFIIITLATNFGISFSYAAQEGDTCKTNADCGQLACASDTQTCELCDPDIGITCSAGSTCDANSGLCKQTGSPPAEKPNNPIGAAPDVSPAQLTADSCGACLQSQLSSCSSQSDAASCLRSNVGKCSAQCSTSGDCQSCVTNRMDFCGTLNNASDIQQCIDTTFTSYCSAQCKATTPTEGDDSTKDNLDTGIDLFGIVKANSLPDLIQGLYTYSLSIVGLLVFIQILHAAYLWGTAAGNSGKIGQAKDILQNAVVGTVLLFGAYLILKTINPDFVNLSFSFGALQNVNPGTVSTQPGGGTGNGGNGTPEQTSCGDFNLVCSSAGTCPALSADGPHFVDLIKQVASQHSIGNGVDTPKFLEAIMRIESFGGKLDALSSAKACGLMQMLPDTANHFWQRCGLSGPVTCDFMRGIGVASKDDAAKADICLAAEYAKSIIGGSNYHGQLRDVAAGYNGGDTGAASALGVSVDCSSQSTASNKYDKDCSDRPTLRYECLWDNAAHTQCNTGYNETRNYVAKFNACYSQ